MQCDTGAPFASASGAVALNELIIFLYLSYYDIITVFTILLYYYYVIILLKLYICLDYSGNRTSAHPVVKVCSADSPAMRRFMIGAVSSVQLLAELSFH